MSRQKRSIKENNDKLKVQLELLRSYTDHFFIRMLSAPIIVRSGVVI